MDTEGTKANADDFDRFNLDDNLSELERKLKKQKKDKRRYSSSSQSVSRSRSRSLKSQKKAQREKSKRKRHHHESTKRSKRHRHRSASSDTPSSREEPQKYFFLKPNPTLPLERNILPGKKNIITRIGPAKTSQRVHQRSICQKPTVVVIKSLLKVTQIKI
jgi:hypothetical protein